MRFHFGNDQLKMLQCNTFQLTNHNTSHQTTLIRNPSSYRLFISHVPTKLEFMYVIVAGGIRSSAFKTRLSY